MKIFKLIAILLLVTPSLVKSTTFEIKLGENFLKEDGSYNFKIDITAGLDKEFYVSITNGKVLAKGGDVKLKNNVIMVSAGKLGQKARDLIIKGITGFFQGQTATAGATGDTKKFTVDIGPGLILGLRA